MYLFQNAKFAVVAFIFILALTAPASGAILGMAGYGICQTGCNTVWVACVAGTGGTAGVTTGGAAVPASILTCNMAQVCSSSHVGTVALLNVYPF